MFFSELCTLTHSLGIVTVNRQPVANGALGNSHQLRHAAGNLASTEARAPQPDGMLNGFQNSRLARRAIQPRNPFVFRADARSLIRRGPPPAVLILFHRMKRSPPR